MSPNVHALAVALALAAAACASPTAGPSTVSDDDTAPPARPTASAPKATASKSAPKASASTAANATKPAPTTESGCSPDLQGAVFCDSFESPSLDARWSGLHFGGGDTMLDDSRAAAGQKSLRAGFGVMPTFGLAQLEIAPAAIVKAPRAALRFRVFLPEDGYPEMLPLAGLSDLGGEAGISLALHESKGIVAMDVANGAAIAGAPVQLGTWACVAISVDRSNGAVVLDVDGTTSAGAVASGNVDRVHLGLSYEDGRNENASVAAWFDDVAVATAPLACP